MSAPSPDQLKLLAHMNVGWDGTEYGAPCIDPKRPYGNGDVELDIARILGWPLHRDEWEDESLTAEQAAEARRLHASMEGVVRWALEFAVEATDVGH